MIQAIVFDFDGVVLESGDIKTDAFVELFSEWPEHRSAIRAHHLANLGISRFEKFRWIYANLLRRELPDSECMALGERFSAIALDRVLACPFVPGALDTLTRLHGRLPLFVASGTPEEELLHIVDARGLARFFDEVHGSPKRKPDVLRSLLSRRGWSADRVLFVGDGETDHRAAVEVGTCFFARRTADVNAFWDSVGAIGEDTLHPLCAHVERLIAGG
jgi:phosphoglycolate phosphatase-like HAD superfamily hydrolase